MSLHSLECEDVTNVFSPLSFAGTKKAQEEERKKDAALYTSLQRFRLRDIREEVDGSFSYEIRRMGVTTWVSHKKMCKTSPESVWLFYRYKGALICEGTRPCKDTLNSLCVSKQTKVLSSAGFVDAKGNPTNEANRAVCPDRTLQGIQQVCDPKSKPPTLPKSLFDDDDDDSSSSSTSERRAAYARSVRLRKRREHILQPRPTTAQYVVLSSFVRVRSASISLTSHHIKHKSQRSNTIQVRSISVQQSGLSSVEILDCTSRRLGCVCT